MDLRARIRRKFEQLAPAMTERARRLWAGAEADAIGWGGVKIVADATRMAISTVRKGRDELRLGVSMATVVRDRRPGAGRKAIEKKDPGIVPALESIVAPLTRGDPESALRWTSKSTKTLAAELTRQGHPVSANKVADLLATSGYSLQGTSRVKEGKNHPDRDAQFEHINALAHELIAREVPVISVDTKKKELVGEHSNRGREWQPKGKPVEVLTYDFAEPDAPKAVPYGVYDVAANKAFVNVGTDHDTPIFAVHSIERWWELIGSVRYPQARELFITADAGGSNSRLSHVWKAQLQAMADRFDIIIRVSHYPPGTSKWNKIEHRVFSFITLNWRGRPLISYETIVSLIAGTKTQKGLAVIAELDKAKYPLGIRVTKHAMKNLNIKPDDFHGEWNYALHPRSQTQLDTIATTAPAEHRPTSHAATKAKWRRLIQEQHLSGLSQRGFCRERGINFNNFSGARHRMLGLIRELIGDKR
jgi:DDE family transposase